MLLAAMIPLALGISSEFYVVVSKVLQSDAVALVAAILMLVLSTDLVRFHSLPPRTERYMKGCKGPIPGG